MTEYDDATLKHILIEYKLDVGKYEWGNKEKVLFHLKSKYGDAFNKERASKLYDKIQKENE